MAPVFGNFWEVFDQLIEIWARNRGCFDQISPAKMHLPRHTDPLVGSWSKFAEALPPGGRNSKEEVASPDEFYVMPHEGKSDVKSVMYHIQVGDCRFTEIMMISFKDLDNLAVSMRLGQALPQLCTVEFFTDAPQQPTYHGSSMHRFTACTCSLCSADHSLRTILITVRVSQSKFGKMNLRLGRRRLWHTGCQLQPLTHWLQVDLLTASRPSCGTHSP
jgi:hypothetical protein